MIYVHFTLKMCYMFFYCEKAQPIINLIFAWCNELKLECSHNPIDFILNTFIEKQIHIISYLLVVLNSICTRIDV